MYKHEEFQRIDKINKGELIMKFPGTNIKIPYKSGTTFINKTNNVGYITLNTKNMIAETVGEPKGLIGLLIAQTAKSLQEPSLKKKNKKIIKTSPLSLFYSKTLNDLEVLTIPGISKSVQISNRHFPRMIIGTYNTLGTNPSIEEIYTFHTQIITNRKLSEDKASLEDNLKILPQKINIIYDNALKLIIQLDF